METNNDMPHCKDCKHWSKTIINKQHWRDAENVGYCNKIIFYQDRVNTIDALDSAPLLNSAIVYSKSEHCGLLTRSEFGCTLFEPAQESFTESIKNLGISF